MRGVLLLFGSPRGALDIICPPIWPAPNSLQMSLWIMSMHKTSADIPASGHLSGEKAPLEGVFCQACSPRRWECVLACGWVAEVVFRWQQGTHCRLYSAGPATTDV